MQSVSLSDFDFLDDCGAVHELTLPADQNSELPFRTEHAVLRATGQTVRVTIFSQSVSQSPAFRRAYKSDRPMLEILRHQAVPRFLGDAEADGRIFFWTEACRDLSLREHLTRGRHFYTEDLIEIGWQVCSALQQAHNIGLSHGELTSDRLLISDLELQMHVTDFGIPRWLHVIRPADAAAASGTPEWRREVESDLQSLSATILEALRFPSAKHTEAVAGSAESAALQRAFLRLLEHTVSRETLPPAFRARDLQGKFGELLIGGESDEILLLDHREHPVMSRRSIVDELFDNADTVIRSTEKRGVAQSAERPFWVQILPVVIIGILAISALIFAIRLL